MTDTQEPLSNISDSSFVILGQGSLPMEANEESCKTPNFGSLTDNYAYSISESTKSTTSNMSQNNSFSENNLAEESIQKKLDELLKENYQLREILTQNNLAIKSQLSAFFMWQQKVLKTHESHKEKFLETKDLILKLRAENSSLKKQLQDSMANVSFVNDTEIYSQVNKKPGELDSLKEKVKTYEKACSDLIEKNEEIKMENQRLKEDLKSSKLEILKLNKELDDFGRENMFLRQKNDYSKNSFESLSHKSLPNSEARAQIANLLKQLDEEKAKVSRLKDELENVKCTNTKSSDLKLSATEEMSQNSDKPNNMNVSLNKQNHQFSGIQSWVSVAEENIKQNEISKGSVIFEINEAKTHLHQEENVSAEKEEALEKLRKQYYRLLDDYKLLQQKLNMVKNNDVSVEKYKEEVSSLLAKLEDKDKQLSLKQQECDSLQEDLKKCNIECEKVALLKIQVELNEDDFNIERRAREKIAEEKEELLERVRILESQLKHLQSDDKSDIAELPHASGHTCLHCLFTFPDQKSLENHTDACLNTFY